MLRFVVTLLISLFLLTSCNGTEVNISPTATFSPTLPNPEVITTGVPNAKNVAEQFLNAWNVGDYQEMYKLLSGESKGIISEEEFSELYKTITGELALKELKYSVFNSTVNPDSAQVEYEIEMFSSIVGTIKRQIAMSLFDLLERTKSFFEIYLIDYSP
jgi:hypothetical protein